MRTYILDLKRKGKIPGGDFVLADMGEAGLLVTRSSLPHIKEAIDTMQSDNTFQLDEPDDPD